VDLLPDCSPSSSVESSVSPRFALGSERAGFRPEGFFFLSPTSLDFGEDGDPRWTATLLRLAGRSSTSSRLLTSLSLRQLSDSSADECSVTASYSTARLDRLPDDLAPSSASRAAFPLGSQWPCAAGQLGTIVFVSSVLCRLRSRSSELGGLDGARSGARGG